MSSSAAGVHVQPMTPEQIVEAEQLSPAWYRPIFAAIRDHGLGVLVLPTQHEPGVLAYPAGADEKRTHALVIARCGGLGPTAFHRELLARRIAQSRFVAITSLPDDQKHPIVEIAIAHALEMNTLLIESPRQFEDEWIGLILDLNGRAQITLDRPRIAASVNYVGHA